MIRWFMRLFRPCREIQDLSDQVLQLRNEISFCQGLCQNLTNRLEKLEQAEKLHARVATARRETARNWSAFRQMAEQAEGVESADR